MSWDAIFEDLSVFVVLPECQADIVNEQLTPVALLWSTLRLSIGDWTFGGLSQIFLSWLLLRAWILHYELAIVLAS